MGVQGDYDQSKTFIGFAHIIYALIVGISYDNLKSVFIPFHFSFQSLTVILAFSVIVQSWVAYNREVSTKPYVGTFKFVLDLLIFFLMFMLLSLSIGDFGYYIAVFPFLFFLLMLWRYGTVRDVYVREGWKNTIRAFKRVLAHVVTSAAIVLIYQLLQPSLNSETHLILDYVVLAIFYAEVFAYYRLRKYDKLGPYFRRKDLPAPTTPKGKDTAANTA